MSSCPDTDIDPNFVPNDSVIKRKLSLYALTFCKAAVKLILQPQLLSLL